MRRLTLAKKWTFGEDTLLKKNFAKGDFVKLVDKLLGRTFKEVMCRAQELKLNRNKTKVNNKDISYYDLILDLAEDTIFD